MAKLTTNLLRIFVLSALYVSMSVSAQSSTTGSEAKKDYCGSGFTEKWVPETLFGCSMAEACKAHDTCYGKCDPGGSKHGTAYCGQSELSPERVKAKQTCEKVFFTEILKQNDNKWRCRALGGIYVSAVALGGQGPFNGKPMPLQAMKDLIDTSNNAEEAVGKFSALAKLSQEKKLDLSKIKRENNVLKGQLLSNQATGNESPFTLQQGMKNKELKIFIQQRQSTQGLPKNDRNLGLNSMDRD